MENKNIVYIASFSDYPIIPKTVLCIGVCMDFPDEFKTTTYRNFLYTPNSILSIGDVSDVDCELSVIKTAYVNHIRNSLTNLGFHSLPEYFGKMFSALLNLSDGEFKSICFLGLNSKDEKDSTAFIKHLLQPLGYSVEQYSSVGKKPLYSQNNALF